MELNTFLTPLELATVTVGRTVVLADLVDADSVKKAKDPRVSDLRLKPYFNTWQ